MLDITIVVLSKSSVNPTTPNPEMLWARGDIVEVVPIGTRQVPPVTTPFFHINVTGVPVTALNKAQRLMEPYTVGNSNTSDATVLGRRRWRIDPDNVPPAIKAELIANRTVTVTFDQIRDRIIHRDGNVLTLMDLG